MVPGGWSRGRAGSHTLLPPLPAASLAVVAGIGLTGAFHEDGLGDTADAFVGHHDRDDTVRILKDPRLGTFGVLAVAASLLLRAGAVAALTPAAALAALPAAHALSRAAAVATMTVLPAAAETGLGASYVLALSRWRALTGAAAGLATRRIGGVTGDVLGAIQQLAEILVLLVAVAAVTSGFSSSPVSSLLALVSGSS